MKKSDARNWVSKNGLTIRQARWLLTELPCTARQSKINKALTQATMRQILVDAIDDIAREYDGNYDLSKTATGTMCAVNIIRECGKFP